MKKLILGIIMLLSLGAQAQISDFTTDYPYFVNTLGVGDVYIEPDDFFCQNEFGFEMGHNEVIWFGIRTINMGNHDADMNLSLDPSGVFFDSCHWHNHIEDWNQVHLLPCVGGAPITTGGKIGFNLQDGGNVMSWLISGVAGGDVLDAWLNTFGTPDYSLSVHPPNDDFNGTTHMGVSAGHYDTYSAGTWGNQVVITGKPNGHYVLHCQGAFSRYFNQGINIFPDEFYVPVILSGTYPNRTIAVTNTFPTCCSYSSLPSIPSKLKITQGNQLSWDASSNAESYNVYRGLAFQGQGGWNVGNFSPVLIGTNIVQNNFTIPPVSGTYFYFVSAVNCFGESQKSNGKRN